MLNLEDFRFYVKCFIDFSNILNKLDKFNIHLESNEEVEYFIGNYSEMLAKMLGLEERTDDFEAFQNLIYGDYGDSCQLDEAIDRLWGKLTITNRVKMYYNVDDMDTIKEAKTVGTTGNDYDWSTMTVGTTDYDWNTIIRNYLKGKEFSLKFTIEE